jgi:PAS domain S-box-containing protein
MTVISKNDPQSMVKESEVKWQSILQNCPDIIISIDRDGRVLFINHTISGIPVEHVIGKELYDFMSPEAVRKAREAIESAFKTGKAARYEIQHQKPDGEIMWLDARVGPNKYKGEIHSVTIVTTDVTECRNAEKALELKNIALREIVAQIEVEKNKIKEDVLANVDELLLPTLKKLRINGASSKYIDLLRRNLENLTSPFGGKVSGKRFKLTPREIEICDMIKNGLTSKEISGLLGVSNQTIEKHRKNIREKLRISNKGINLTTFLQQL